MKPVAVIVLTLLGIYWLIAHTPPFPFSHEQLGLYAHDAHRLTGVAFLIAAGLVGWKWNPKKG
jgi:hypothetical protein